MSELISLREYGRRKGVSDTTVRKAIKSGKIIDGVVYKKKKPYINPEIADKEWTDNRNPNYARENNAQLDNQDPEQQKADIKSVSRLKSAQAQIDLQMSVIKLKAMEGKYVDRNKVYIELFNAANELKNNLMSIPDRCIDEILSAPSRNEAHSILVRYINEALASITRENAIQI